MHATRKVASSTPKRGIVTKTLFMLVTVSLCSAMLGGCSGREDTNQGGTGSLAADDDSTSVRLESGTAEETPYTQTVSDADGSQDSPEGNETTGENRETGQKQAIQMPAASNLPPGRTSDEVAEAVTAYVEGNYPDTSVDKVELIGSGSTPSQQNADEEDYWVSYLATMATGNKVGLRVTCSSTTEPYVSETDTLTVSDGLVYDVTDDTYDSVDVQDGDDESMGAMIAEEDEELTQFLMSHNEE